MNPQSAYPSSSGSANIRSAEAEIERLANLLGYAGLIPFVTLSILYVVLGNPSLTDLRILLGQALLSYGAVIVSFLSAFHWAVSVTGVSGESASSRLLFAVSLPVLAWFATLVPLVYGFALAIAGLLGAYTADHYWRITPAWYRLLRKRLTIIAVLSMTAAFISTL